MTRQQDITTTSERPVRDLGVEIIRIIAMLLIVCQHFLNHGAFLKNAGENEFFLNLIHVLFAPSVNVFVLITGYFSANTRKLKVKRGVELWIQVLFYSLATLPIASLLGATVTDAYVLTRFAPIIYRYYWFFSAYFVLFLLTPYLSAMLSAITKKQHLALVLGIFLFSYLSTRFDIGKVLSLGNGYSVLWFIMLFCVGAYLRKYPIRLNRIYPLMLYVVTVIVHMVFRYYLNDTTKLVNKLIYSGTNYDQPLTLLAAVAIFLTFCGIKSNGSRLHRFICYIGSCTFGVYLFHEAPVLRGLIYEKIFTTSNYWGHPQAALIVIAFATLTFIAGCIMETLRKLLFGLVKLAYARIKREMAEKEGE